MEIHYGLHMPHSNVPIALPAKSVFSQTGNIISAKFIVVVA